MQIRNIALIAHVDHGKTTLADALLKQSDTFRERGLQGETVLDSNPLERERGITILAKNCAVMYNATKINIVDTPGHADFGGEVERIMNLVDGALLLVDAKEGPMPQTRFVLKKAIDAGHRVIVVINKIDKPDARPDWVLDRTFDLFVELGASDVQADFPVVYASAKQGKAGMENDLAHMTDIRPLFETILREIPNPKAEPDGPLQVSVANVAYDSYIGRIAIGRVVRERFPRDRRRGSSATEPSLRRKSPRSCSSWGWNVKRSHRRTRATSWRLPASRKSISARPSRIRSIRTPCP